MKPVPINRFESGTGSINRFQKKNRSTSLNLMRNRSTNSAKRNRVFDFFQISKQAIYPDKPLIQCKRGS